MFSFFFISIFLLSISAHMVQERIIHVLLENTIVEFNATLELEFTKKLLIMFVEYYY